METLSQYAWCTQDWALLERCESSLRLMEGAYGPLWRTFRIRRMLALGQSTDEDSAKKSSEPAKTGEIDDLTRQLESLYPHMQQTRIAAGRVANYRGQLWRAVGHFEEAWQLGTPSVSLAVELIGLLNELGENARAQRYVSEVRRHLASSKRVIMSGLISEDQESADESIRLAEALAERNPRSQTFLNLGRTLVLTSFETQEDYQERLERAELAFRRAVEIEPTSTRTWAALFRYLVSVRTDLVESQEVLEQLANHEQIPLLDRTFALAQLTESIGNTEVADRHYHRALELAEEEGYPSNRVVVLERAAQYFRHHQPTTSEACCRKALELAPAALGPQQILVNLLLDRGTPESVSEAIHVVKSFSEDWLQTDPGRRLQAEVLVRAARLQLDDWNIVRQQAIEILQNLANRSSRDALRLAELFLLGNSKSPAMEQLRRIQATSPAEGLEVLSFLRTYDKQLIADTRSRLLADQLYDRLEEIPEVAMEALDTRIEASLNRVTDGDFAVKQNERSYLIQRYIRRIVAQADGPPAKFAAVVRLMRHLLLTNRWEQAEQLTQLTPELLPTPRTTSALATALAICDPGIEAAVILEPRFQAWLEEFPDDSELMFAVANVRLTLGRFEQAATLYRKCLARNPNHAMLRNNLALSEAFYDPALKSSSLELIQEAIDLDGRQPEYLDSMAVIQMLTGNHQEATELLLEAVSISVPDALQFLHLADAWIGIGQGEMARYAFNMARSRNVAGVLRLPYDRKLYDQLQSTIGTIGHE